MSIPPVSCPDHCQQHPDHVCITPVAPEPTDQDTLQVYGYCDESGHGEPVLGVVVGGVNLSADQARTVALHIMATALEVGQIGARIRPAR